ncbi:MAG TPA: bifunctional 2-C-methyl-D-erythritol 4-phosphate cytidylyltransferase/2-C-methyl-D-erythritol 2,4-cyclodiphosphate synthase [Stellaceae bacterium]|nr:bifunctional 2-C-methyl-D-erythritol 4-phosphate cytidylyltransferase/2-C-methyl-D-erythritol 2,4-cyclodiphosphate synthase [Stellaceae bacterium]
MRTVALIVAAGRGARMGGDTPKQYRMLGDRCVLAHTIGAFADHPQVDDVCVVINPADAASYDKAAAGRRLLPPVAGGDTRQESVRLGLESLLAAPPSHVLIHDGARPLVDAATISRALAALDQYSGAVAAIPIADTIKREADGLATSGVEREGLWRAQTPQAFRFDDIVAAHRHAAGLTLTDDAAVAERAGLAVKLVAGSEDNIKITTADDLARAERILAARAGSTRVGMGYDVHAFGPARPLMLCGIAVPHERGLAGHSDADVGLHALTDAILGALGEGDIGEHFPPGDPRWKDAASDRFLHHAAGLVAARGGRIAHVDVTLICERPQISPHRAAMRARIAAILGVPIERVSVKATTTEGLGFTGRGEGIAAQAVATLNLPHREA